MAKGKKSYQLVQLVNSEVDTKTKYIRSKPTRGEKASNKLEMRKFDPVTRQHHVFKEKKMPSHSK